MYNKIFTSILDSSLWLESNPTRIIWFTFLAAMDEDGYARFASVANLAHRARVTLQETEEAVKCLESPDKDSSDPDNEGRRIERVQGGWIVLNAGKYRELVTRSVAQERNRLRVAKHRESKRACNGPVMGSEKCNGSVTQSESDTGSNTGSETKTKTLKPKLELKPKLKGEPLAYGDTSQEESSLQTSTGANEVVPDFRTKADIDAWTRG